MTVLLALLLRALPTPPPPPPAKLAWREGEGTTFGPASTDDSNPVDVLACRYPERLTTHAGVASYALPCGSLVRVCDALTWRCAVLPVIDRGPRRTRTEGRRGKALRRAERLQRIDLDVSVGGARLLGWPAVTRRRIVWAPLNQEGSGAAVAIGGNQ